MGTNAKKIGAAAAALLLALCLPFGTIAASAKQFLPQEDAAYAARYADLNSAKRAGNELNERIAEEGMILLKNGETDGKPALPLAAGERRISVFGSRSDCEIDGGTGSGGGSTFEPVSFLEAMEDYGFELNPKLKALYAANGAGELGAGSYTQDIVSSYAQYSDLAIIFFSRTGHEGSDFSPDLGNGKHELEPNNNELALLKHVTEQASQGVFKRVLLILNVGNVVEVGDYVDNPEVDAVLYAGMGGSVGMKAVPKILTGDINPSGRTVDIWPADFTKDPTWGNMLTNTHVGGTTVNIGTAPDGKALPTSVRSLDYEEGIYVGYKWYETAGTIDGWFSEAAEDQSSLPGQADDPYYNRSNGVLFPFGYGLSYTSFSWTMGETSFSGEITEAQAGDRVSIPVTVKNTGGVPGKDVVQAYVRAPYDAETAPVEKSDVSLITFAKTKLLQPGEEQTVTLEFDISDLASFDWNDANGNGFQGYELEPGAYSVLLRSDSHTDKGEELHVDYTVSACISYDKDGIDDPLNYNKGFGEETAKAVFSQNDEFNTARVGRQIDLMGETTYITEADAKYVSRSNWYQPEPPTDAELTYSDAAVDVLFDQVYYGACKDDPSDPWYKSEEDIPGYGQTGDVEGGWKQAPKGSDPNRVCEIRLSDMTGVPLDDPLWVEFMNQLTWSEMTNLLTQAYFETAAIPAIGKPKTYDADGPAQLRNNKNGGQKGTFWCNATLIACTYNLELCYEQGQHVAMEGMLMETDGSTVNGWYGPGLNTHRSPFGGRNFEYYSQDGVQGGMIAGAVIGGATEMGMHVYAKHYVVNDQDTGRKSNGGISVWVNEQALREVYLRQFEYAVEYGNLNGMMNSHGRMGLYATQNNYYLNTAVPRNEWGYEGVAVTDLVDGAPVGSGRTQVTNADQLIRSGSTFLGNLANQRRGEDPWFDGRILDGYYDAATNRLLVPESLEVTDWKCTGRANGSPDQAENQGIYFTATVTAGEFTLDSPTQWYWVRTTAMNSLYVAANSNQMQSVEDSDLVGAYVQIRYNDGVTPDEGYNVVKGSLIDEPEKTPVVPEGKRFAGWYTDSSCTEPFDFSKPVTKYTELYAFITDADQFAAIFDLNYAGAPQSGSILIKRDTAATPPPFEPLREGYGFGGWYLEPECDTQAVFSEILMTEDKTFYAKWIPEGRYTVTFDMNCGGVFPVHEETVDAEGYLTEPLFTPEREGYVFEGWYRDSYCMAEADFTRPVTSDMTLYAKWTKAPAEAEPAFTDTESVLLIAVTVAGTVLMCGALAALAAGIVRLLKRK